MRRWTLWLVALTALLAACSPPRCEGGECVASLRTYRPPEATRLFAADGSLLADLSPQRRVVMALEDIPSEVRDAFVAVEDRRFWQHRGVDYRGMVRAVGRNVASLSFREGFSTITMQLARNVFPEALPRAKQLRRKTWETVLAYRIERAFSKNEILELYLNQIYLGGGLYGVEAAAQGYFGKSVAELDAAETALLVALARSPEGYNPRRHPLRAIQRRNVVLSVLVREGVITEETAEAARAAPLRLAAPPDAAGPAPYFVAAVRRELRERYGPEADVMGLRVRTTMVPDIQRAARAALTEQIRRIEAGEYGPYSHPVPDNGAEAAADDSASPYLQGMVVALDTRDGGVLALVGGRDFRLSQFDRALQARRQPGSAFKPIVYAAALERGLTLASRIETGPIAIADAGSPVWRPGDHVRDTVAALDVREAMALSSNHAAVRVGRWVGEPEVGAMASRLGLSTPIPPYPSIHLGAAEVIPAELVAAYAAFANGGYRVRPRLISRIEAPDGRVLWSAPTSRVRVLEEGLAFLSLQLLEGVVNQGTGTAVRSSGFRLAAAGKTGTSNDGRDAWFVGMTPDIAAGVWIGFDRPTPIGAGGGQGGRLAAPVWAELMTGVYQERPAPGTWYPPAGVVARTVNLESGRLATGNCPEEQRRTEYFMAGTEPTEFCDLHPESAPERFLRRVWRGLRGVF